MKRYIVSASWCEELKSLHCMAESKAEAVARFEAKFPGVETWYWQTKEPDVTCIEEKPVMQEYWEHDGFTCVLERGRWTG